jgi:hypothetical protein
MRVEGKVKYAISEQIVYEQAYLRKGFCIWLLIIARLLAMHEMKRRRGDISECKFGQLI